MRTTRHVAPRRIGATVIATAGPLPRTLTLAVAAAFTALTPLPAHPQQRLFTPEIALDVRGVGIAAVTDDGSRVAATVRTRRDRTGVDHQRYGDPTYISPGSVRLMVIDTRSGDRTWVHEEPAQLRGFEWSPGGERLAYIAVEDGAYRLRIFDARTGRAEAVALRTEKGDRVVVAAGVGSRWRRGADRAAPRRVGGGGGARPSSPLPRRRSSCRIPATISWPGTA